jgi:hypothetical protein
VLNMVELGCVHSLTALRRQSPTLHRPSSAAPMEVSRNVKCVASEKLSASMIDVQSAVEAEDAYTKIATK